jgi:hypothetical protein
MINKVFRSAFLKQSNLFAFSSRSNQSYFNPLDGPYNPNKYNPMLTPKDYPTNKEIESLANTFARMPPQPRTTTIHLLE